jgi:hypothetical protein
LTVIVPASNAALVLSTTDAMIGVVGGAPCAVVAGNKLKVKANKVAKIGAFR